MNKLAVVHENRHIFLQKFVVERTKHFVENEFFFTYLDKALPALQHIRILEFYEPVHEQKKKLSDKFTNAINYRLHQFNIILTFHKN